MKKILILGGAGQMGSVIALKLLPSYHVTVGDICDVPHHFYTDWDIHGLPYGKHTEYKHIDVSKIDFKDLQKEFKKYDLIVSCIPSWYGSNIIHAAADIGVNCVDLSFNKDDPFYFDDIAKENNCTIVPDAGLAPGLSNLFVGRKLAEHGKLRVADIYAGGISQSPFESYGYKVTWSVEDLMEEYIRLARCVLSHKIYEFDPFSTIIYWMINEVQMESFKTDGLRTLLRLKDRIQHMSEYALRWVGHMKVVRELINDGTFVEEIKKNCTNGADTVILQIRTQHTIDDSYEKATMITHATPGYSAMAKTTAGTCAIVANMVLQGVYNEPGVHPLEDVGENRIAFQFILDKLAEDGVNFKVS